MNKQMTLFEEANDIRYGDEQAILGWLQTNYPRLNFRKTTRDNICCFWSKWELAEEDDCLQFTLGATSYKHDSHYLSPRIEVNGEFMKGACTSVHSYKYLGELIDKFIKEKTYEIQNWR
jgi:hypothetical protein